MTFPRRHPPPRRCDHRPLDRVGAAHRRHAARRAAVGHGRRRGPRCCAGAAQRQRPQRAHGGRPAGRLVTVEGGRVRAIEQFVADPAAVAAFGPDPVPETEEQIMIAEQNIDTPARCTRRGRGDVQAILTGSPPTSTGPPTRPSRTLPGHRSSPGRVRAVWRGLRRPARSDPRHSRLTPPRENRPLAPPCPGCPWLRS